MHAQCTTTRKQCTKHREDDRVILNNSEKAIFSRAANQKKKNNQRKKKVDMCDAHFHISFIKCWLDGVALARCPRAAGKEPAGAPGHLCSCQHDGLARAVASCLVVGIYAVGRGRKGTHSPESYGQGRVESSHSCA